MAGTSARWVFLLALGLAIFGEIQCPHTDPPGSPKRSSRPLKSIGKAISRKFSRIRSGRSSRSGSGSDSGGARSGSDNDEMPASGNGSGRFPRSPSPGGGGESWGGAGSSGAGSSSGRFTINKMYGGYQTDKIPNMCVEINNREAAQIVNNMQVSDFSRIIREMRETAASDECKLNANIRGHQRGSQKCQEMYGEFKKIEPQYRGECADAIAAQCVLWPPSTGAQGEKKCTFFVRTGYRSNLRLDGFYASLEDCVEGIKHQLFMDNQLAGMGINPPTSPPKPLLPPGYSPEY